MGSEPCYISDIERLYKETYIYIVSQIKNRSHFVKFEKKKYIIQSKYIYLVLEQMKVDGL